jgi:Uma2 family endonuclease
MLDPPSDVARSSPPREPPDARAGDHIVVLRGASWADYQRVLEIRGDRSAPRITYLEGTLELMSPSKDHEGIKSMIGRLVEAWCLERGVDISPYGAWTLEKKEVDRGVEPDECYVVGDNPHAERPDFAIEVVWTSGGLDKLDVYRKLGVREVWYWERGTLQVHALRDERYEAIAASEVLPELDLHLLQRFIDVRPMTQAVRQYREALKSPR